MKACWIFLACLLLATPSLAAPAAKSSAVDRNQPVEIAADRMEADDVAKSVVFSGHAVAKQGDIVIQADRLTIFYTGKSGGDDVERIVGEGNVRIEQGERLATGGKAEFFRGEERVVLTGSPQVKEGQNLVKGNEIVLYLKENRSVVRGGQGGRVNAVFQPKPGGAR